MIDKLAIIGVGLIGSSLSLALKQAGAVRQVIGFGRNQQNLARGVELGVLDAFADSIEATVSDADVIVVAVPLGAMVKGSSDRYRQPRRLPRSTLSASGAVFRACMKIVGSSSPLCSKPIRMLSL